jgi:hypothetical protein
MCVLPADAALKLKGRSSTVLQASVSFSATSELVLFPVVLALGSVAREIPPSA